MRKRQKRIRENVFCEILQTRAASDYEQRVLRVYMTNNMKKEWEDKKKAQESQQVKEWEMHQDIMDLLKQQTQMLQTQVVLQVQNPRLSPVCSPWRTPWSLLSIPPNIPCGITGHILTHTTPCQVSAKKTTTSHTLNCENHDWCMCSHNGLHLFTQMDINVSFLYNFKFLPSSVILKIYITLAVGRGVCTLIFCTVFSTP